MKLSQFRYIRDLQDRSEFGETLIRRWPKLKPFMVEYDTRMYGLKGDPEMTFHELGHCMDVMYRGKPEKMKEEDFGYPRTKHIQLMGVPAVIVETRVFAFQFLLHEVLGVERTKDSILSPGAVEIFLEATSGKPNSRQEWLDRIYANMDLHRPTVLALADKTVEYIVTECAEYI